MEAEVGTRLKTFIKSEKIAPEETRMPEIKRRTKKDPPPTDTAAPPPRQARVTLTKDVSSRYRKLVPRARAGGSTPSRPPRSKGPAPRPATRPEQAPKPPRRDSPSWPPPLKTLIQRELPEMTRQLRETQQLLLVTAKEILPLLEDWVGRPLEETLQTLVTALLEKTSFQDLAGQRLAKVENFLKVLDEITRPTASTGRFQPRRDKPFSKTGPAGGSKFNQSRRDKPFSQAGPAGGSKSSQSRRDKPFSQAGSAGGSKSSQSRRDKPFSKTGPAGGSKSSRPHRDKPPSSGGKNLKGPQAAGGGLNQNEVESLLTGLVRQKPARPRKTARQRALTPTQ
jgi:hypothetical protein